MKTIVAALAFAATVVFLSTPAAADPAPPRCAGFPDAGCTGPVGDLSPYTGSQQFRTSGQVIENVEIQTATGIYIAPSASGMTFRNVRFVYTGPMNATFTAINNQAAGVTFDNVEIDGRAKVARAIAGTGTNTTVRNCNIHHAGNGLEIDAPMDVENNYIHDIYTPAGQSWHADGIQTPAGRSNIRIVHNTVVNIGAETSAIAIEGTPTAPAQNVLIENNILAGGGYTMYTRYGSNYRVIDNHFSTRIFPNVGRWNIWYPGQEGIDRTGNVIAETGASANS